MSDLVSIIIPVYNQGRDLPKCLASCLNQTHSRLEIIIVDNCSTDPKTIELIAQAKQDPRVRWVTTPQRHDVVYARNLGAQVCHGTYLTFLEPKDSLARNFVERCLQAIREQPCDFVVTNYRTYTVDTTEHSPWPQLGHPWPQACHAEPDTLACPYAPYAVQDLDYALHHSLFFCFPENPLGKLFVTQRYREAHLHFYSEDHQTDHADAIWSGNLHFKLKSFYYLPICGAFEQVAPHYTGWDDLVTHYQQALATVCVKHAYLQSNDLAADYQRPFLSALLMVYRRFAAPSLTLEQRRHLLIQAYQAYEQATAQQVSRWSAELDFNSSFVWTGFYQALYEGEYRPRVWCFSLYNLYDKTNKQLQAVRRWLTGLSDLGCPCLAVMGSLYRNLSATKAIWDVLQPLHTKLAYQDQMDIDPRYLHFTDNSIESLYLRLSANESSELTAEDLNLIKAQLQRMMAQDGRPHVVFVTGSDPFSLELYAWLKQQGLKLIYLVTGAETGLVPVTAAAPAPEALAMFDAVVGFSAAQCQESSALLQHPVQNLGYLVRQPLPLTKQPSRFYISVPSTSPEYGMAIVLKLMLVAAEQHPEWEFLLCEESGVVLQELVSKMHLADGSPLGPDLNALTKCSCVQQPLDYDSFYDCSRVMVLPHLQSGYWAEEIVHSLSNGVPVLTSELSEKLTVQSSVCPVASPEGSSEGCPVPAVTYLPMPASTMADALCLPSDEEIAPYVAALEQYCAQDIQQLREHTRAAYAELDKGTAAQQAWLKLLQAYGGAKVEFSFTGTYGVLSECRTRTIAKRSLDPLWYSAMVEQMELQEKMRHPLKHSREIKKFIVRASKHVKESYQEMVEQQKAELKQHQEYKAFCASFC